MTVTYANNVNVGTATASATYAGDANYIRQQRLGDLRDHEGGDDHDGDLPGQRDLHRRGDRAVHGGRDGTDAERPRWP